MSISLTRRDALKGAMAAGAAIAASPYLLNLSGGVERSPVNNAPATSNVAPTTAVGAVEQSDSPSGTTTVLVIKGDVVNSYSGIRTIKVQDAELAAKLRNAITARIE
jgi:hypothetical protein